MPEIHIAKFLLYFALLLYQVLYLTVCSTIAKYFMYQSKIAVRVPTLSCCCSIEIYFTVQWNLIISKFSPQHGTAALHRSALFPAPLCSFFQKISKDRSQKGFGKNQYSQKISLKWPDFPSIHRHFVQLFSGQQKFKNILLELKFGYTK